MNDRVRTVRSGIVGVDLALGGGFRLVNRTQLGDRESATLLVRGGPGTGKSVLAQDLALRLAGELGGDVLYFCVEVLPSEVIAQRMGFDGFDEHTVFDLSRQGLRDPAATQPHLVLGMRDIPVDDGDTPDVGAAVLDVARIAIERGFRPKVVVIDSLSDGYGLGSQVPRPSVDGVCKLAAEQGWTLVLVEETVDDVMSNWTFAVDTVLSLRLSPAEHAQNRRELVVTKHRFGSCEPGPHRLQIERDRVRVIPPFSAYRNAERDIRWPERATDRSLYVPTEVEVADRSVFDLPDGEGAIVVVYGDSADEIESITAEIGRRTRTGAEHPGSFATFSLYERTARSVSDTGFQIGTMRQFIDGEDWLEDTISHLVAWDRPVARVRIGPTSHLAAYEYAVDVDRGVSLFADVLNRAGFLTVLYGGTAAAPSPVRAAIVAQNWRLAPTAGPAAPHREVYVARADGAPFKFVPALANM